MSEWLNIEQIITRYMGESYSVQSVSKVAGGSINSSYVLADISGQKYFVKTNKTELHEMFVAETRGLAEIENTQTIGVPKFVGEGKDSRQSFLILEFLELAASSRRSTIDFAEQLARMHRCTKKQYGWYQNNTIGSTQQINTYAAEWVSFWQKHRLGFQLALAESNGYGQRLQIKGDKLLANIPVFFNNHFPGASLLHGDLWSGNYGFTCDGHPVIFDPAVYYGDREADIAMTELFGNFGRDFYASYNNAFPLSADYAVRKVLYNLYHILNHLNLFGAGYLSQAESMIDYLLAEIS